MAIGEFGGAPPLVAEGSPAVSTPMYWMYEMMQASLNPARAVGARDQAVVSESDEPLDADRDRQIDCRRLRGVRAHHPPLRQARMESADHRSQRHPHPGRSPRGLGKAVLPAAVLRSQDHPAAAQPAAARADRGA